MSEKRTVKVEIEVEVPQEWLDFAGGGCGYNDLFLRSHCGYWLKGIVTVKKGRAWIARDEVEEPSSAKDDDVVRDFKAGAALPEHYYLIDEDFMCRAFAEGVKLFGADWFEQSRYDANTCDHVVQMALFGKRNYA